MWSFFSVANVDFYLTCQRPVMPRIFIQWMFFGDNVQIPRNWFHIPKYAEHSLPACKFANCGCQGKLNASHSDLACISQNFHHLEVLYLVSCMISRTNPFLHFWSEDFEVRPSGWQVYFVLICFLVQSGDDVFTPTDEPHGTIEARLSRKH